MVPVSRNIWNHGRCACAAAVALALLAAAPAARATLVASESFEYGPADGTLVDRDGGTGWGGGWRSNVNNYATYYDASPNLSVTVAGYDNSGNGGGSAGWASGTLAAHPRLFATPLTQSDLWFSALVSVDATTDRGLLWLDSTTTDGTAAKTFMGILNGTASFRYNNVTSAGAAVDADTTYLLVGRVELNVSGANDRFSFWFDPADVSSQSSLGAATFSADTADVFGTSITGIGIQFGGGTTFGGQIDALRVGTDLADVVPEPGSLALLLLGMGGVAIRFRKPRQF